MWLSVSMMMGGDQSRENKVEEKQESKEKSGSSHDTQPAAAEGNNLYKWYTKKWKFRCFCNF